MHSTNIKQEVGYLGPHEQIIEVGDEKHIVFQEGSVLLFIMTPQQHVATKSSQYDESQLKDKTKYELLGNLKSAGADISVVNAKRVCKLQYIPYKFFIFNKQNK